MPEPDDEPAPAVTVEEDSLDAPPGASVDELERLLARVVQAPAVTPPPVERDRIGRYVVLGRIGAGGMGVVVSAHDPQLERKVAIKVLRSGSLGDGHSARARERAVREARALARLVHPNIVAVHDAGVHHDELYIVMELVVGQNLRDWLAARPRTEGEVVGVFRQAAAGLIAAHAAGMVHRDFKPDNMLVGDDGRVRVADFGLVQLAAGPHDDAGAITPPATTTDEPRDLTVTGAFMGTPAYMAPEQLAGAPIDHRADQYAFGVSLWQALYGALPFPGANLAARRQQRAAGPPPEPPGRRVSSWLRAVVRRTLAAAPADRFVDMAAVARALERGGQRRRGRALAIGGLALLAAGAAALAVGLAARPASRPPWRAEVAALEPAYDENGNFNGFSPDGTLLAYDSDREHAGVFRLYVRPVHGAGDDRAVSPPGVDVMPFGWLADGALLFRDRARGDELLRVAATGGAPTVIGHGRGAVQCGRGLLVGVSAPASPGCQRCTRFVLRDPAGGERAVVEVDGEIHDVRCDRAGQRFVYAAMPPGEQGLYPAADLWLVDVATGARRQLTHDRKFNFLAAFTPDRDSVVFTSGRGGRMNLWELPLAGGAPVQLTTGEGNDLGADVSPDGRTLAFNVDVTAQPLFARPTAGGAARRVTPARLILIGLQATPDGQEVIATDLGALTPRIVAVQVADGAVRAIAEGALAAVTPDGAEVVVAGSGLPSRLTIGPLRGGGPARTLAELDGRVFAVGVGVDGFVHLDLLRGGVREAWRVPRAGGPAVREAPAPWCFVQVAPVGDARVWSRCTRSATPSAMVGVLAHGAAPPDPDAPGFALDVPGGFDAAAARYVYAGHGQVGLVDVATGAVRTLFDEVSNGIAIAPDGQTVYSVLVIGRVRRHLLTNFADRPRP